MASINGNWLHSRSSSNIEELISVRDLVNESSKREYAGMQWSGGRQANQRLYELAAVRGIQPSTMQTKIRAMIRYGFIRDGNTCPLIWTRLGKLWNDLYSIGNYSAARKIYGLTLTISLAIYAFNDLPDQYSPNPANGVMPLKFLLNNLDNIGAISLNALEVLIDGQSPRVGKNFAYWKSDLLNSGIFVERDGNLVYSGKYLSLVNEIKNFSPSPLLTDADWDEIRADPLIDISPFNNSIRKIFEEILAEDQIEEQLSDVISTTPIVELISEQNERLLPEIDILSENDHYSQYSRPIRNGIWGTRIKQKYNYRCVLPNCDVTGQIFVVGAHIKPYDLPEEGIPHKAHLLNGICLCGNCHIAFDKGYFSLTDESKIIISSKWDNIADQNLKRVMLSSTDKKIKDRVDNRYPLIEFIQYHRNNIFKA